MKLMRRCIGRVHIRASCTAVFRPFMEEFTTNDSTTILRHHWVFKLIFADSQQSLCLHCLLVRVFILHYCGCTFSAHPYPYKKRLNMLYVYALIRRQDGSGLARCNLSEIPFFPTGSLPFWYEAIPAPLFKGTIFDRAGLLKQYRRSNRPQAWRHRLSSNIIVVH